MIDVASCVENCLLLTFIKVAKCRKVFSYLSHLYKLTWFFVDILKGTKMDILFVVWVPLLKVSKSQKQIMVSWILPENECWGNFRFLEESRTRYFFFAIYWPLSREEKILEDFFWKHRFAVHCIIFMNHCYIATLVPALLTLWLKKKMMLFQCII